MGAGSPDLGIPPPKGMSDGTHIGHGVIEYESARGKEHGHTKDLSLTQLSAHTSATVPFPLFSFSSCTPCLLPSIKRKKHGATGGSKVMAVCVLPTHTS